MLIRGPQMIGSEYAVTKFQVVGLMSCSMTNPSQLAPTQG